VGGVLVELGLVGVAVGCNLAVRWYTLDDVDTAVAHARDLLDLQRALGVDWERAIQDATLAMPWLSHNLSWFYVWGYFPAVFAAMVGLYVARPTAYALLRNALLLSGLVGLLFYAFYPCAPPRLAGLGYTDTVLGNDALDAAARPSGLANEIAAIPSFHMAWLIVAAVVVFITTRSRWLRLLCVLEPALMAYAVVATGNHWVLDVPAGAALAAVGLYGATRLSVLSPRTSGPVPA
jgi:membrane-associated phospholipid phosphatase